MVRRSILVSTLSVLMVLSLTGSVRAMPPITDKLHLKVATLEGGNPETVDPACCYDTASAELIMNVYDTLIIFDGERMDRYLPSIAENWTIQQINETSPEGLHWYYRYTFKIRSGVKFYDILGHVYDLTPQDVEFSFERAMVQDRAGGPQWMFYEPLLNGQSADYINGVSYNLTNTADIIKVGKMIDHAVESNSTHVWFNLAFPGAYPPFIQILCQPWSSILSKQWINSYVIGELGRHDWSGEWGDYTGWINYHNPEISPLDDPTPIMCGSGPFMLETLNYTDQYWTVVRNVNYWRGWPADFPKLGPTKPAGWVDRVTVSWHWNWEARRDMFLAGDVDFCAVPRKFISQVFNKPGIRCIYPLPALAVDGLFFMFDINPATAYGKVYPPGEFHEDGIPRDFFGNATWGVHVRRAFAYAFDYDRYIEEAYGGDASHPATAIIPGLPYYDPTVKGYYYNLTKAAQEFQQVPGLWETGFTIAVPSIYARYFEGIGSLNRKFHIISGQSTAMFFIGWLADYADPHNFAYAFYYSKGMFAAWQGYCNSTMDNLIKMGIATPDGPERAAIYEQIQLLAVADCPNLPIVQPIGRHFERDWVVGWYYNPIYPGVYAYNIWKWYYVPAADYTTYPAGGVKIADIDFSGLVETRDVAMACAAFGSYFGPPMHPKWNFRADVNFDRMVDTKDISFICRQYGKSGPPWTYP